ncbi:Glycosyltransferase involved in cell wall bisynthesis [Salegentibacter echinorum]|uniref:Glycosyltransferase involved in cell wall bisynthesis n=1 Tax=Salegentibacter echinorum TaxID=1073325 RepID=A0A1M5JWR2_SALEC|nr:glycosyltransferase family 4 protein [Salegentibacter echinorum]SHG44974.1 Glycosyltransferase involved in cell wall bisynthesis [Salegentibacter echinorum]
MIFYIMHIAFLTPEYPNPATGNSGGLGTSIKNLATSLVTQNIEVSVFIYSQKEDSSFKENGINFYLIKHKKYTFFGWYLYRKHLQQLLNKFIKSKKIDLVEAPDWIGITAFIKLKCPIIIRMHGSDAYFCALEGRKQKWKNRLFEERALKSADALLSVSAFTAEKTRKIFNLKKPISIIPNSIEIGNFPPSAIQPKENRLLYFGTIIRKKGVLELVEIFNEIVLKKPETELLLIGKDVVDIFEKRSTLELFREKLSAVALNQLTYLPEVSYTEIKEHLATATVILLPSFAEALPMTWLEAMAMEKSVVTSNIGWAVEVMINGKTGFTEDPKLHKAYSEKVLYLLNNPEEAKIMGKTARQQVIKKFSSEVVVKKNLGFYKQILQKQ